jgi:hypothetical protein
LLRNDRCGVAELQERAEINFGLRSAAKSHQ